MRCISNSINAAEPTCNLTRRRGSERFRLLLSQRSVCMVAMWLIIAVFSVTVNSSGASGSSTSVVSSAANLMGNAQQAAFDTVPEFLQHGEQTTLNDVHDLIMDNFPEGSLRNLTHSDIIDGYEWFLGDSRKII